MITICGNIDNASKERFGYTVNLNCPTYVLKVYSDRIKEDGGIFETEECTLIFINDKINK